MTTGHPFPERRKHPRLAFAYPVAFRFTTPDIAPRIFRGMIQDISMGGACILFDYRYLRIAIDAVPGLRVKLELLPPEGDPIHLLAVIRWARGEGPKEAWTLLMGVEFQDVLFWDQEKIDKFLALTGRDKQMMWNLWDAYHDPVGK